jgi:hypothetical protein
LHTIAADPTAPDSIQRAVDALGPDGGVVYLPPGNYVVQRTTKLRSGVAIVGAGAGATTITLAPGSNCHVFTNDNHDKGNEGIEFRGFALDGDMRNQHRPPDHQALTFACGGYFKRVRRLVVADVVARRIRQTAFHFNHCTDVELLRLHADELGWSGVSTSGTDDIRLHGAEVTNAGLDIRHSGIHLDGGRGAYVDAVVDGCTGNGIMLDSKFSPLSDVVVHGVARRSLRGLSLSGDHENELVHVSVNGGDYSDNRECGLLVSNASHVFVVDATFASNGKAGIVLQGKSGATHCVVAGCRITGSPDLVLERDGHKMAYVTTTAVISVAQDVAPLAAAEGGAPPAAAPAVSAASAPTVLHRLRSRIAPSKPRATAPAAVATATRAPAAAAPAVPDDDAFDGTCNVCGERQRFVRKNASLREGYRCANCKASLRYRGQADAILRVYSKAGSTSIAELVREPHFALLDFWEPGVLGPFRTYFGPLPRYVVSDYWPDVEPGDERDGVRCEDLMSLTFEPESFDLVVTSDIFEHVRKPYVGFAEVHRVLRTGGRHIFSIPVQEPMRAVTQVRVDTSGDEDVYILEPRYHLGPNNSQHIVYNDFGRDLLDGLAEVGFETEIVRFESTHAEAARLLTFCSVRA